MRHHSEKQVKCPYNQNHVMPQLRLQWHLIDCPDGKKNGHMFEQCFYHREHIIRKGKGLMEIHLQTCEHKQKYDLEQLKNNSTQKTQEQDVKGNGNWGEEENGNWGQEENNSSWGAEEKTNNNDDGFKTTEPFKQWGQKKPQSQKNNNYFNPKNNKNAYSKSENQNQKKPQNKFNMLDDQSVPQKQIEEKDLEDIKKFEDMKSKFWQLKVEDDSMLFNVDQQIINNKQVSSKQEKIQEFTNDNDNEDNFPSLSDIAPKQKLINNNETSQPSQTKSKAIVEDQQNSVPKKKNENKFDEQNYPSLQDNNVKIQKSQDKAPQQKNEQLAEKKENKTQNTKKKINLFD